MSYSVEIANAVKTYLINDNWKYSFDQEDGVFRFGLNLTCKLRKTSYKIVLGNQGYTVYADIPVSAEDCIQDMAEFVCRANYGLRNGNFELDVQDGELRYKSYVNCNEQLPNHKIIEASIYVPAVMIERYGSGILEVIFGIKTPEKAIEDCENS